MRVTRTAFIHLQAARSHSMLIPICRPGGAQETSRPPLWRRIPRRLRPSIPCRKVKRPHVHEAASGSAHSLSELRQTTGQGSQGAPCPRAPVSWTRTTSCLPTHIVRTSNASLEKSCNTTWENLQLRLHFTCSCDRPSMLRKRRRFDQV